MLRDGVRLFVVRHGETDWNAQGRMQGQQDIPLNAVGEDQARAVGQRLIQLAPDVASLRFIASPMLRTRQTMDILRATLGLSVGGYALDERLKELTFGEWEGLTWKEVRKVDPERAALRMADKWAYVPPGGESYAMLADRVALWLSEQESDAVVVAHGGTARVMLYLIAGVPPERAPLIDIWQGRVMSFQRGAYRWD